ncbi:MAG: FecR domain-containing protein [Pseudomonadota bacterium]
MSRIDDEALEWVARQAAGEPGEGERAAFDAWYAAAPRHQGAYLRAKALQYSLDQMAIQESLRPGLRAAPAPADELEPAPLPHGRGRRALLGWGALAAGLAAVAFTGLMPAAVERTVLTTAKGEFRKVTLADRSVVSLNGDSRVEVALTKSERRIYLERGEAWFEVAKDKRKPFIVAAGDARARAVGTAFAVRRREHGADVLVTEGVVEVWSDKGSAQKQQIAAGARALVPDQAAQIAVTRDPGEVARRLAWRDGRLVFNNENLADAVDDFNRYNRRQLVIVDPALRRKTLVGNYRIDQPEHFADDLHALWKVPVAVTADSIRIGAAPGAKRGARGG